MLLAMAIGVAAVVVLTSLGEGARRYVTGEFASLGTNLLIVIPGRSETSGGAPTTFVGETPRDLTIDDARIGLAAFTKKPEFGPASIISTNVTTRWPSTSNRPGPLEATVKRSSG